MARSTAGRRSIPGVASIDFAVAVDGTITGKVIDENHEPVPGMTVYLVSREYYLGSLGYFFSDVGGTDDRGQYTLKRVSPGRPYLILVEKRARRLPARSETPLNPKLRKRAPMRTWYPNSPSKDGAMTIVVRPGERLENMDIELRKSPSYCLEGVLLGGGGPAPLHFSIEALQPSSGISGRGGMFVSAPQATTDSDGKFRVCDLYTRSHHPDDAPGGGRPPH